MTTQRGIVLAGLLLATVGMGAAHADTKADRKEIEGGLCPHVESDTAQRYQSIVRTGDRRHDVQGGGWQPHAAHENGSDVEADVRHVYLYQNHAEDNEMGLAGQCGAAGRDHPHDRHDENAGRQDASRHIRQQVAGQVGQAGGGLAFAANRSDCGNHDNGWQALHGSRADTEKVSASKSCRHLCKEF